MLEQRKTKAIVFEWAKGDEADMFERLRHAAASKLCVYIEHGAGGGSSYVTIGDIKLRFANHENTSSKYEEPDYNFVKEYPTEEELQCIIGDIGYPKVCKKTAFAMHVGLTIPKMKKLLSPACFEEVCEDEYYENTYTQYVVVAAALEILAAAGVTDRIPIRQESYSVEDFDG